MEKLKALYLRIPKFVRNRYTITLLAFLAYMLISERYNWKERMEIQHELDDLRSERDFYQKEFNKVQQERNALLNDSLQLERLAREKYFMKRDNEQVFIIDTDTI